MENPSVSFVVPCYKLAHLLPVCINSILSQTYGNFEALIMDDCSPDNTAEVAKSFHDPRVRHIRNDPNLGHLQNYNKGISLARGKYVWLISADDYLRVPYVLQRYVDLLDTHATVGYVFCPGYGVRDGLETRLLGRYSQHGDCIIPGHVFLRNLLPSNFVLTPSGLVRRDCYENISLFPLGLPWCGDWYLWCLFALHRDVGYFAEPMVCYREEHSSSMTHKLMRESLDACGVEEIAIPWSIKEQAQGLGYSQMAKACLSAVARTYARTLASERYRQSSLFMNFEQFEDSLRLKTSSELERNLVRTRVYASVGNEYYWQRDLATAKQFYQMALKQDPWMASVHIKLLLIALGKRGDYIRRRILLFR